MAKRRLSPEARPYRCRLYNAQTGQSMLIEGQDAIERRDALLDSGEWLDTPPKLAQSDPDADLSVRIQELNRALAAQHSDLTAAKTALHEAEAKAKQAEERATAAESESRKLAAALKRAKANANRE